MTNNKILGIGIDIVDINRFKKLKLNKDSHFLNNIFTTNELQYCFSKKNVASKLAIKFAGKEAVIKACNNIIKTKDYKKIEILNNSSKAPYVKLHYNNAGEYQIMISLSDESDTAVAVAIVINQN